MKLEKRLALYKAALKDYQYVFDNYDAYQQAYRTERDENPFRIGQIPLNWPPVKFGFCPYFENAYEMDVYGEMEHVLPELDRQKELDGEPMHYLYPGIGDIQGISDRVNALESAIKICENE